MPAKRNKMGWRDRLIYQPKEVPRGTTNRYYKKYRQEQGLPTSRCDNEACDFYSSPMKWCGKELKPVLDHINGFPLDNRPENLHFLCPNCNSQRPTQGGRNRGRCIDFGDHKFTLDSKESRLDSYIIPPSGGMVMETKKPRRRRADAKRRKER